MKYVFRWWYSDGSGNGVHPQVFTDKEREKITDLLELLHPSEEWEFVEIYGDEGGSE